MWYNGGMKKILRIVLPMLIMVLAVVVLASSSVSALTLQEGAEAARCDGCPADLFGDNGVFKKITNTILYIVGIIAVIMLIIGGIRYVTSGGDAKKVTDAKNTVLYAIIGLVIAFLAFAIVNFVISALPSSDKKEETSLLLETTNGQKCNNDILSSGLPELFDSGFHAGAGGPNVIEKKVGGGWIDFNVRIN